MKRFNGYICQWQEFLDCFGSSVDKNLNCSLVMKLNYLRDLLDGPAKAAISGFESRNVNYSEALDVLKERYGKKAENLPPIKDEDNIADLKRFQDTQIVL